MKITLSTGKKYRRHQTKKDKATLFFFVPWCALAKNIEHIQPKKKNKTTFLFSCEVFGTVGLAFPLHFTQDLPPARMAEWFEARETPETKALKKSFDLTTKDSQIFHFGALLELPDVSTTREENDIM